jgi:hypothetical protein
MVLAAIGHNFKSSLIFIEGTLDSNEYIKMLKDNQVFEQMKQSFNSQHLKYQQDGAPAHTARCSVNFLKEQVTLVENWPSNSPDLSPMKIFAVS